MTKILFYLFVSVFAVETIFAFIAMGIIIFKPDHAEQYPIFKKFAWVLWTTVLGGTASGVFALWRNLFKL